MQQGGKLTKIILMKNPMNKKMLFTHVWNQHLCNEIALYFRTIGKKPELYNRDPFPENAPLKGEKILDSSKYGTKNISLAYMPLTSGILT